MVAQKFGPHSFRAKSSSFAKIFHKFFSLGLLSPQLLVLARGGPKFIQPTRASSDLLFKNHLLFQKHLFNNDLFQNEFFSK